MSLYHCHIEKVLRYFHRDQVQFILFDGFTANPVLICRKIFEWMGIDSSFLPDVNKKYNVTKKVQSMAFAKLLHQFLDNRNPVKRVLKKVLPEQGSYQMGEMLRTLNKSEKYHTPIHATTRRYLIDFFKPHNEKLSTLTGLDLSAWNQ
jgi:hypothetical protein